MEASLSAESPSIWSFGSTWFLVAVHLFALVEVFGLGFHPGYMFVFYVYEALIAFVLGLQRALREPGSRSDRPVMRFGQVAMSLGAIGLGLILLQVQLGWPFEFGRDTAYLGSPREVSDLAVMVFGIFLGLTLPIATHVSILRRVMKGERPERHGNWQGGLVVPRMAALMFGGVACKLGPEVGIVVLVVIRVLTDTLGTAHEIEMSKR